MMKSLLIAGVLACAGADLMLPGRALAQVEVDRIVSRVSGRVITLSDIRQAGTLRLVADASSEEAGHE